MALLAAAAVLVWVGWPRVEDEPAPEPAPFVVDAAAPTPTVDPTVKPASAVLEIPTLGIRAPFGAGAVVAKQLRIPSDSAELTIYDRGAVPCASEGTVLLAGHVVAYGVHGALWDLHRVRGNELVYTGCQDGSTAVWRVVEVRVERKRDLPQDIFTDAGDPRLVIVTCGGPIVTDEDGDRVHRDNVIVYAEPVAVDQASK